MLLTPPSIGVVDVQKLHVEKHALSRPPQFVDQRQPAGEDKLHADLEEARAVAKPFDQSSRFAHAGDVERNDHPVARVPGLKVGAHRHLRAS